jgi:hypothetical protein
VFLQCVAPAGAGDRLALVFVLEIVASQLDALIRVAVGDHFAARPEQCGQVALPVRQQRRADAD